MKVILVENEPDIIEIYSFFVYDLFGEKTSVETAGDGLQAINKIMEHKYDLIWTDIKMPLMDGISLIKNLRQYSLPNATTPILVTTAMESLIEELDTFGLNNLLCVKKPCGSEEITEALKQLLPKMLLKPV